MRNNITLITGGDRGIGRETATYLINKGHKVCIGYYTRKDCAHEVLGKIRYAGSTAIAVQADISQEKQVVALFQQIDKELGPVLGLVNNVGILMPQASSPEQS